MAPQRLILAGDTESAVSPVFLCAVFHVTEDQDRYETEQKCARALFPILVLIKRMTWCQERVGPRDSLRLGCI